MTKGSAMPQRSSTAARPMRDEEAIGYRLLVLTVFLGCMPIAAVRWAVPRHGAAARPSGRSPLGDALECARNTVAHVYSMPG